MDRGHFMRPWRSNRNSTNSRRSPRALRLEDLESRQLLSVSPVGGEVFIGEWNDTGTPNGVMPKDVATDSAGNFVVVWQERIGSDYDIFARRFDAAGNAQGSEFLVNAVTTGDQVKPAAALGDGGELVITWQSWVGSDWTVVASFYDAAGNLLNGDVSVTAGDVFYEPNPDVAISSAGRVLIVAGVNMEVKAFDTSGVPQGSLNGVPFTASVPKVGFAENGDYVIAGFEADQAVWQRFDSSDEPKSLRFNRTTLASGAYSYEFAMNRLGEFVVAAIDEEGVHVQRVGLNDTVLGIPVNVPVTSDMNSFALAMDDAGNIAVGTVNLSFSPPQTWSAVYIFNADNTLNDVLTFDDGGMVQFQPPALAMHGTGEGVVILNRIQSEEGIRLADLTAQRFTTDNLFVSGLLGADLDIVDQDMIVPVEMRSFDVRWSREASIAGGSSGAHSVTNLANWQLWRGNSNVSNQIVGIEYANGKATLTLLAPLDTGEYRLIATDAIQDVNGNPLDGDQDGMPGGVAERRFVVSTVQPVGQPIATDARSSIDVAANSHGEFATVSLRSSRIRAQFFSPDNVPTSGELNLASIVGSTPRMPPKAFLDEAANLHVFWTEQSGLSYWATYSSAGVLQRPILSLLNSVFAVDMADNGRVVILASTGIQLFNADGTVSGSPVPPGTLGTGSLSDIAFLSDGDVIIAEIRYASQQNERLFVHRISASGQVISEPVLVESYADLSKVTVAASPMGGYAVGWQSSITVPPEVSEYPPIIRYRRQIGVRAFGADGMPLGVKTVVASETTAATPAENPLWAPAIDFDGAGRFVIAWQDTSIDGDRLGVAARGYFADGTPQGPAFRVNSPRVGMQSSPALAANTVGQLAIGWLHDGKSRLQFFELFAQPTIDLNGVAPGLSFADAYTPDQFFQPLAGNLTISDAGYSPLYGARVQIRSAVPGDQLLIDTSGTSLVAVFAGGALTISGEADRATYEQVLRTVTFQPALSRITGELIEINFSVDMGVVSSAVSTAALSLYLPGSVSIVNRWLFYNNSGFDNSPQINQWDELARATDKTAYLPGTGPATFANISSYNKGINGLMIDLSDDHGELSLADFTFRAGRNNQPETWETFPVPNGFMITALDETTHRITFTWPDGSIGNAWLEVTVKANAQTGLAAPDVFYFGNRIGDSGLGNSAAAAITSAADQLAARANAAGGVSVTNPFDFNRNKVVSAGDELTARFNPGILLMLNLPAAAIPGAAPLVAQATVAATAIAASDLPLSSAVASALAQRSLEAAPAANIAPEPRVTPTPAARELNAVALAIALEDESEPLVRTIVAEESDDDSLLGELLAL